jgi:hypothetical protein
MCPYSQAHVHIYSRRRRKSPKSANGGGVQEGFGGGGDALDGERDERGDSVVGFRPHGYETLQGYNM